MQQRVPGSLRPIQITSDVDIQKLRPMQIDEDQNNDRQGSICFENNDLRERSTSLRFPNHLRSKISLINFKFDQQSAKIV